MEHRDIKALIFDFDGTLAELNIDFKEMQSKVMSLARQMGFGGPWPPGYLLEQVQALGKVMADGFAQRAHRIIREMEMEAAQKGRLFDFTPGLLAQAGAQGFKAAVISRNCGDAIRLVFPEVEGGGRVFLPREKVKRPKPHPEHVLAACRGLGVDPSESLMVGDHPTDIEAGLAAGARTVGVASGRMGRRDLLQAGAELVLDDASTLLQSLAAR